MSLPTDPPAWVDGVPGVGRTPVLVTGGTGTLGRAVLAELARSGVPARVLTRRPEHGLDLPEGVEHHLGDLSTGAGVTAAADGVQAVVHCATSGREAERVDVEGTRVLTRTLTEVAPEAHLVHLSIVGAHANPLRYYQAKVAAETVVTAWDGPHTVLRATQFHTLVHQLTKASMGPIGLNIRGIRFAPVDPAYVAVRAVDLALSPPPGQDLEVAGPEIHSGRDLAVLTARLEGRATPRMVPLPAVGQTLGAFARGSNLPDPDAERGGSTYAQWLAARLSR
ncbi:SDR family oxidoreductase [Dermacoccaceae bacterium W4C1]